MMTDDELDRALFNLPLAEPPSGMRASILAMTAYAPRPMLRAWETIGLGVALALCAWLMVAIVTTGGPAVAFAGEFAESLAKALSDGQTLIWLSSGAGIAVVASLFDSRFAFRGRS